MSWRGIPSSGKAELAHLDKQQLIDQMHVQTATLADYCHRVEVNLSRFDMTEKKRALEALSLTVIWYPDRPIKITGSIPISLDYPTSHAPYCMIVKTSRNRLLDLKGYREPEHGHVEGIQSKTPLCAVEPW
jgi:hypothetical protein